MNPLEELIVLINETVDQGQLVRLKGGLLALPGFNDFKCSQLGVLIHPYNQFVYENDSDNPHYEERRDDLVKNYPQPLLLGLEGIDEINEEITLYWSLEWLESLNPQGPRIIYITDSANPLPIFPLDWEGLSLALFENTHSSEAFIGGAELHRKGETISPHLGCVNQAYFNLAKYFSKIRIDEEYCWKCE